MSEEIVYELQEIRASIRNLQNAVDTSYYIVYRVKCHACEQTAEGINVDEHITFTDRVLHRGWTRGNGLQWICPDCKPHIVLEAK